ncbi:FAD-dependent oxidoreductase [Arthrobacter psychrolactophilus]
MNGWDREVDLLVVGTGAAGLSAAITGADAGLKTLVVESTELWGGTTMRSGGGLWMPTNPLMNGLGVKDSVEDALTYMEAAIGEAGPASSAARRRAFVHAVPSVFALLDRLGMTWAAAKDYPDYYPDRPGGRVGRSIEPVPFDARVLGDWLKSSRYKEGLPVPLKNDDVWLLSRACSLPAALFAAPALCSARWAAWSQARSSLAWARRCP